MTQLDLLSGCQRWRRRRASYRPAGEPIDPSRYGVELLPGDKAARAFVEAHHYSGSYPAAALRVGLYRAQAGPAPTGAQLVGVAVFSVPCQPRAIPRWCGVEAREGVELGRLVLLDDVPANGETWFLARAFNLLRAARPHCRAVLSYSDPVPRRAADGRLVLPGHVGTVYQALGATYHGRSSARTLLLDADGRPVSGRALSKLRGGEVGREYARRALLAAGAPAQEPGEEIGAYLLRAVAHLRPLRHGGNHAYTWRLDRRRAPNPDRYPKRADDEAR